MAPVSEAASQNPGVYCLSRSRLSLLVPVLIAVVLIAVVLAGSYYVPWSTRSTHAPMRNQISLQGVSLCASNCWYPSPYLSATVFVNGSVPLSSLHLFINGTDEGILTYSNTMTSYALVFKAQPKNPAIVTLDLRVISVPRAKKKAKKKPKK